MSHALCFLSIIISSRYRNVFNNVRGTRSVRGYNKTCCKENSTPIARNYGIEDCHMFTNTLIRLS